MNEALARFPLNASAPRLLPAFVRCRTPPERISAPLPAYISSSLYCFSSSSHIATSNTQLSLIYHPSNHSSPHAARTIYTYNVYCYSPSFVSLYTPASILCTSTISMHYVHVPRSHARVLFMIRNISRHGGFIGTMKGQGTNLASRWGTRGMPHEKDRGLSIAHTQMASTEQPKGRTNSPCGSSTSPLICSELNPIR
jgi:hypothetical protein